MYHAVLVAALSAAVPAAEPAARPSGPPPQMMAVKYDKEGFLTAITTVPVYKEVERNQVVIVDGKPVTTIVKSAVMESVPVTRQYKVKDMKLFGLDGLPIDADKLPKLLARETMVLVSPDGRPLDSFYTQFFKEGTLVIVLPTPKAEAIPVPLPRPIPPPREDR
jgi:hypothetical protein